MVISVLTVIMHFLFIDQGLLPRNTLPYRTRFHVFCQSLLLVFSVYLVYPYASLFMFISLSKFLSNSLSYKLISL
jgi:hypothetical protein